MRAKSGRALCCYGRAGRVDWGLGVRLIEKVALVALVLNSVSEGQFGHENKTQIDVVLRKG